MHSNEHVCGRCNDLWSKMRRVGKVLDTKSGTEFCDQNCHGFLFPHSAAGNMQLFLPMRVVVDLHASQMYLFVRLQQL